MDIYNRLRYDELFAEADYQISQKKYAEAMQLLESILAEEPEYGKAYNHIGWIYETVLKDYAKAEDNYRKSLLYAPDYHAAYLNLSIVLSQQSKWEDLEKVLNAALELKGIDKANIYNEFGIMYELQGKYSNAINYYKKAILTTLNNQNINTYKDSVERCNQKLKMLE